jgi:rhodanese-related sulfurtransferase
MTQKFPAIIRDTAILLVASAFLGFAYNAFSSKRLAWVRVASDRIMASDSLINTLATASNQVTTPPQANILPASSQSAAAFAPNTDSLKSAQNLASKKDSLKAVQNLAPKKEALKSNTGTESTSSSPQASEQAASTPTANAPAASGNSNKPLEIRIDQVEKLLANPDVLFIDARKGNEFEKGHIGNAINIFTPEFEQSIPRIIGLPREKPIAVYCGGGACELSHELAGYLVGLGFKRVFVYTGGWNEWQQKKGL